MGSALSRYWAADKVTTHHWPSCQWRRFVDLSTDLWNDTLSSFNEWAAIALTVDMMMVTKNCTRCIYGSGKLDRFLVSAILLSWAVGCFQLFSSEFSKWKVDKQNQHTPVQRRCKFNFNLMIYWIYLGFDRSSDCDLNLKNETW